MSNRRVTNICDVNTVSLLFFYLLYCVILNHVTTTLLSEASNPVTKFMVYIIPFVRGVATSRLLELCWCKYF